MFVSPSKCSHLLQQGRQWAVYLCVQPEFAEANRIPCLNVFDPPQNSPSLVVLTSPQPVP